MKINLKPIQFFGAVLLFLAFAGGCGGNNSPNSGPAPASSTTVAISPSSVNVTVGHTQQFTATVSGSSNTAVTWSVNGVVGGSSNTGIISITGLYTPPDPIPVGGSSVTVTAASQSNSSSSATAQVALIYPAPLITSFDPNSFFVGGPDISISINGQGFARASMVTLNGQDLHTTFNAGTHLTATLPASRMTLAGAFTIGVKNPSPGGGAGSSNTPLTIQNLSPNIGSIDPSAVQAGALATRITVNGTNFLPSSNVQLSGATIPGIYVSSTQLIASVPASDLGSPAMLPLTVTNPAPGGGVSGSVTLVVSTDPASEPIPGRDQDGTPDPEAPVLLIGPPEAGSKAGSSDANVASIDPTNSGICTFSGSTPGFTGACIRSVKWVYQVPDGGTIEDSGNCGLASLAIVHSLYQHSEPSQQDILDLINFVGERACNKGETCRFPGLGIWDKTTNTCKVDENTKPNFKVDPKNGPDCGLGEGHLVTIATDYYKFNAATVGRSVTASASSEDQLAPLFFLLQNGSPVIVHLQYEMVSEQTGHYMVLVGMDADPFGFVYVMDPGRKTFAEYSTSSGPIHSGTITIAYTKATFLKNWSKNGRYGAVVISPKNLAGAQPLGIVAQSLLLPSGAIAAPYSAVIGARNGQPPYQWSIAAGELPPGLALDSSTGTISGIAGAVGAFGFTVQVMDISGNRASAISSLTIANQGAGLTITTPGELPVGESGVNYSVQLTAAGSTAPYSWSSTGGIPAGLNITADGHISGVPVAAITAQPFVVQVRDSVSPSHTTQKTVTLTIIPADLPPVISSLTASPMTVSPGSNATITCAAFDPEASALSYSWSATGGNINGSGSSILWVAPSQSGQYTVTCSVSEGSGKKSSKTVVLAITNTTLLSSASPTTGLVGTTQFMTSGSKATPKGSVTSVIQLPDGTSQTRKTAADATGQYVYSPFIATQPGIHSEVDVDDSTGAQSNTVTWKADASTGIDLTATASCPNHPQVVLSWTSVVATFYTIYRDGGPYMDGIQGTTFTDTTNLTPGNSYTYYVVAKLSNGVTQNSNSATVTIPSTCSPPQKADLVPQNVTLSSSSVAAGGTVTVNLTMANQGTAAAGASTTRIRLSLSSTGPGLNDPVLGDVSTPGIAAGSSTPLTTTVTIPSGTAAGTYFVWAIADNFSVVSQSNTGNDFARSSALTVNGAPPPSISSISPTTMTASTTALTTLTVNGSNFSTSGGQLQFTDPNGVPFSTTAHPERIVSVTPTQWVYQVNNGGTAGTWQMRVVNANGQISNVASFAVR